MFVAIDLETTGLDPQKHVICEFGATIFDFSRIYETYSEILYVSRAQRAAATPEALNAHKITEGEMLTGMAFEVVLSNFQRLCSKHGALHEYKAFFQNAPFDVSFLLASDAVQRNEWIAKKLLRRTVDTVTMGFICQPLDELSSLSTLAKMYTSKEIQDWHAGQKHRAGPDSIMTAHVAQGMMRRIYMSPADRESALLLVAKQVVAEIDAEIAAGSIDLSPRTVDLGDGTRMEFPSPITQSEAPCGRVFADGMVASLKPFSFGNARLMTTLPHMDPGLIDRSWVFDSFQNGYAALLAWDYPNEIEPTGWFRSYHDGRRRENGDPSKEYIQW